MKLICALAWVFLLAASAVAQTASLRGRVLDESGAVIPGAKVALAGPGGFAKTATSAADGAYSFRDLPPGNYTVQASAPDLALAEPLALVLEGGPRTLDVQLSVSAAKQQVTIEDAAGPGVSTEAASNASALVMRGTDLDALPDDPDDLASALQALAGPSAGPNGGSIFIDGFSGGELPPKESIREIRLNQNPFSRRARPYPAWWPPAMVCSIPTRRPARGFCRATSDAAPARSCSTCGWAGPSPLGHRGKARPRLRRLRAGRWAEVETAGPPPARSVSKEFLRASRRLPTAGSTSPSRCTSAT
jgi:hypothetical protein